jgi:hypothetical protein
VDAQIPVADGEEAGSGLVEAAMEISRKRTQMMEQMRKALETGDEKQALSLARLLVGLGQTPVVMVVTALLPVILV